MTDWKQQRIDQVQKQIALQKSAQHLPDFRSEYGPAIDLPINAAMHEIYHQNPGQTMAWYVDAVMAELARFRDTNPTANPKRFGKRQIETALALWFNVANS